MSTQAASQQHDQQPNASILDGIIAQTRLTPQDDGYSVARRGVAAFIEELLKPQNQGEPVKKTRAEGLTSELEAPL